MAVGVGVGIYTSVDIGNDFLGDVFSGETQIYVSCPD